TGWIAPDDPPDPRKAARLVARMALALREAHDHGIVHRDLKPANVMINGRGEPVVMDFGLARLIHAEDERITQSGATLGTPAYMAPEQVAGDLRAIGPATDIYALGVILFELLTGRRPFRGPTLYALYEQILKVPPVAPSTLRPGLDPRLDAVCLRAMAKAP